MNKWMSNLLLSRKNAEEKKSLESWRDQMTANLKNMQEAIDHERSMDQLKGYVEVNKDAAWKRIAGKTDQIVQQKTQFSLYTKIAAAMIFVLASWFIFKMTGDINAESQEYTYDVCKEIILKDQTKVQLEAKSILTDLGNRKTSLSGRAFFNVTKDAENPFEVTLHHGKVTVLGTAFDIITNISYTQIYVTEGKVKFSRDAESFILTAGDIITIDSTGLTRSHQPKIQATAWQTQKLVFQNETLVNVLYSVASYYQMKLKFDSSMDSIVDNCKINSTYSKETLTQILNELSTIAGLKYYILDKNTIVIQSFKC